MDFNRYDCIAPSTKETLCLVGQGAIAQDDSIYIRYRKMIIVLEIERDTGIILKVDMNSICRITQRFVEGLLQGLSITTQFDEIEHRIKSRYLGNSPTVIIVALRDALNRMSALRKN